MKRMKFLTMNLIQLQKTDLDVVDDIEKLKGPCIRGAGCKTCQQLP